MTAVPTLSLAHAASVPAILRRLGACVAVALVLMLAACTVDPSDDTPSGGLEIYGNGVRIENGHHSPNTTDGTDFGTADAGDDGTSVVRTFTARNTSGQDIAFAEITPRVRLEGGDNEDFAVSVDLPGILPAQSEVTFRIVFAPNLVGERTTVLEIPYLHNQVEEAFTAQILGEGISRGRLQVLGENEQTISPNSTVFSSDLGTDFGNVLNDGSEISVSTYALHNIAESGVLEISEVRLTGANAEDFSVFIQPDAPIGHGSSDQLSIQFVPEEGVTGHRFARVEVRSSDALISPYVWYIRGTAVAPEEAPAGDF